MLATDAQLQELHAAYVRETGYALPLTMPRMFAWEAWAAAGLTARDVHDLVLYHRAQARARRPARSLVFRTFVRDTEAAQEDLAVLRAQRRRPTVDPARASVLRATGRPEPTVAAAESSPARPAGEVAAAALAAFLALRDAPAKPAPGQNHEEAK